MKIISLLLIVFLTACGGVGTEPRTGEGESPQEATVNPESIQDISKNVGCTEEVEEAIIGVAQLCAANMNVDVNRILCLAEANSLVSEHPNFVCSLESGQLVDADYIKENFISSIEG